VDLTTLLNELDAAIGDARQGLPSDVFLMVSRLTPMVNVDLLIQDDAGRILLTWRDDQYFGVGWHLPGGMVRFKEQAADRIRACARHELGVDVTHDAEPLMVLETVRGARDRGHLISLLYRCRLRGALDEQQRAASEAPAVGAWRWFSRFPPNMIDVHAPYAKFFQSS
jgi:ADP-ribose pyrophosphatase YjhB (NUDIX family)